MGWGKNIGVGCHSLLQEIFPTQGSNPGLPHCRQTLYHLSHHLYSRYSIFTCLWFRGLLFLMDNNSVNKVLCKYQMMHKKENWHLKSTYYVLLSILSAFYIVFQLICRETYLIFNIKPVFQMRVYCSNSLRPIGHLP